MSTTTQSLEYVAGKLPALGKTVLVTGAGISGVGIALLLKNLGCDVVIADSNPTSLARATEVTGARPMSIEEASAKLEGFSLVVTSPGWRPDTPLLRAAQEVGIEVLGDVELCYRLDRAEVFGPRRTWMVVTGTNGKTTTTSMLAGMMKQGGHRAEAVGNIGVSVAEALAAPERIDVLVAELSSFQLHWSKELVPDVGILLNLAEDHIDWHGSFEAYAEAKAKVLRAPIAIIGADDALVRAQAERLGASPYGFTLKEPAQGELGVVDEMLVDNAFAENTVIAPTEGIEPVGIPGIYDALAAAAGARAQGVSAEDIAEALSTFHVASHRGQVVGRIASLAGGADIIAVDNSKATNPHAADSALSGHDSVLWVAGGQLKGAEIDDLVRTHAAKLKAVAVLGVDRQIIADAVARYAPQADVKVVDSTDPEEAMDAAVEFCCELAAPGDVILLAPAAASLDMYTGMGERGMIFERAFKKQADTIASKR